MKSTLGHVVLNVQPTHLSFYKDLFGFLGWDVLYDDPAMLGVGDKNEHSLWFGVDVKEVANDYDGPGVNHLGVNVEAQADVDALATYLAERDVAHLFETPRHRPEFAADESQTYYHCLAA